MKMGQKLSLPLTITFLLTLIPLSQSWGLFRQNNDQMPQPPSSGASTSTLAEEALNKIKSGTHLNGKNPGTNAGGSGGFSERILPAYEENPELIPLWNLFTPTMPKILRETIPAFIKTIILYKPPVGITSLYVFLNLVLSRNRKLVRSLFLDVLDDGSERQPMNMMNRRKKQVGRNLDLDEADGKLSLGLGGVEAVRTELCIAALEAMEGDDYDADENDETESANHNHNAAAPLPTRPKTPTSSRIDARTQHVQKSSFPTSDARFHLTKPLTRSKYISAVKDALRKNASPREAREDYIESTLISLSQLEGLFCAYKDFDETFYARQRPSTKNQSQHHQNENIDIDILWMSAKVAEVRTLDALLRVLRQRLLVSAMRLSKKEKYRAWRLQWYDNGFGRIFKRYLRKTIRGKTVYGDRVSLQLTSAALKREMERLGQVQILLLNRPTELSEMRLLLATSEAENGSGSGRQVDATKAILALQSSKTSHLMNEHVKEHTHEGNSIHTFTLEAHEWTVKSRALVNELVTETLTAAFQPNDRVTRDRNTTVAHDLQTLSEWANYDKCDLEGWNSALILTENLSKARLMREQKYLPSATDLKYMLKRFDFYSVPSSLATIGGALIIHNSLKPYWPDIISAGKFLSETIWGVIEFRFWTPAKDIILDLLNRRPKLLDPYSLANEEKSLDNMLKDLGFGDGTGMNRPEALAEASRMYEKELAQGAVKNLFRGDMIRLLLIQLQQLKTGSLLALGSIDDLMDSNRLNVQLLATIPAFLLVTFGTRLFFRAMFSFRSRELVVGFSDAKTEMMDLLRKMERCLLLASHKEDVFGSPNDDSDASNKDLISANSSSLVKLQANELGEFVLHMHSYLTILDYCSPPFPAKTSDAIHSGMQDLLMQGQLSTQRQIALLQVSIF